MAGTVRKWAPPTMRRVAVTSAALAVVCGTLVQSHDLATNGGRYVPTAAIGRVALFTFPIYFMKDLDAINIMKKAFAYVNASPTLPPRNARASLLPSVRRGSRRYRRA